MPEHQPTYHVISAYLAVCDCGRECHHPDRSTAELCARAHAIDCTVALGTLCHDDAVIDIGGDLTELITLREQDAASMDVVEEPRILGEREAATDA